MGRDADVRDTDLAILCVPDAQLRAAAERCPSSIMLAHCSGATTLEPLAMHEAFSLHPLMTVTKETTDFSGAGCAVHATSDHARAICLQLAAALHMRPFEVSDELRPLYHAAASAASNYIVTVATFAERLAEAANVPRDMLAPLTRAAVENWSRLGASALTGPVARGDEHTVELQRRAVLAHAPDSLALWDALVAATRTVAARAAHQTSTTSEDLH
jgi:predicted short-subunit dehydrogenase-like oxidoreductase (DUF2520 family)